MRALEPHVRAHVRKQPLPPQIKHAPFKQGLSALPQAPAHTRHHTLSQGNGKEDRRKEAKESEAGGREKAQEGEGGEEGADPKEFVTENVPTSCDAVYLYVYMY